MPSTILLRSPGGTDDKRIVLNNSQFGRAFSFGSWNRIRIGIRLGFRDYGANLPGNPFFAFGLCSGQTNMAGDVTTSNFLGMFINANTWTRGATGPMYTLGSLSYAYKKGTTVTTTGTLASSSIAFGADALNGLQRTAMLLDYTRGSPNWSVQGFYRGAAGVVSDVTRDQFMDYMEVATMATNGIANHNASTAVAIADATINEAGDGTLDTVNVMWGRTHALCEISDIAISRFS